jgi:hypothetical protein
MFKHKFILSCLFTCLSAPALAADFLPENDPCGELHWMGHARATIYNPSNYHWNVIFKTDAVYTENLRERINAGAVKYLSNGGWADVGTGDYRTQKLYKIPVPPHSQTDIAYCASSHNSGSSPMMMGTVDFEEPSAASHEYPSNGVHFHSTVNESQMPRFYNVGNTNYVSYNRIPTGEFAWGSLTICPSDPWCLQP